MSRKTDDSIAEMEVMLRVTGLKSVKARKRIQGFSCPTLTVYCH
jgi:hypothetical protein